MNAIRLFLILALAPFVLQARAHDKTGYTSARQQFPAVQQHPSPDDPLSRVEESRPRNGLPNFFRKLKSGKAVTIAYLGGSITEAGSGYREQSAAWIQKQYPAAKITAVNAGVGGTGSDLACFRLQKQVLSRHPDLVFVEFAVNDKDTDTTRIHETMEGIVRQVWKNDAATDICFVYTLTADLAPVLAAGRLPAAARAMEDIAQYYHIPSVDMCLKIIDLFRKGDLVFNGRPEDYPGKMVFSADNVHPYPQTGHRLYTEALTRSLQQMSGIGKGVAAPHNPGPPLTANRYEDTQMISSDRLKKTGEWEKLSAAKGNGGTLTPVPFPVLIKADHAGASIIVRFRGTMVGLYDVVGPGSGKWDVFLDGKPYRSFTRFDRFSTYWRPNYIVLSDFPPGLHTAEFRVSADVLDKKTLLADKAGELISNPDKYRESSGYVGFLLLAGSVEDKDSAPVKIACIGNSITYGYGIPDRERNAYPAQLESLLGDSYAVTNYGVNGATLVSRGRIPYIKTAAYRRALHSRPDIVFIMLGTNDTKPRDSTLLDAFERDYTALVQSFQRLATHPKVILLSPVTCFLTETASLSDNTIRQRIMPCIQQVAFDRQLELIDLHSLTIDRPGLYTDKLHLNAEGAALVAARLFEAVRQKADTAFSILQKIPEPKTITSFYGYPCADFQLNGRACKIVAPKQTAPSHPWVWRARFWGHEPQTDIALLERGYHIVYCDVAELYGNAQAIQYWNRFYDWLQQAGLAKKAVLEGMSRGGVYIYNWAAVNSEKVACIYADNPVLDLKSWPGGRGRGPGSKNDWEIFKADYGFHSDAEAMTFSGSPIDKVKEIAAGGYPMLHVCGDADEVVPMVENTEPFSRRILALKGNITVIHKPGFNHHPHSLPDPTPIVDFILKSVIGTR